MTPSDEFHVHAFSDISHAPFNVFDYSRMKFGSARAARMFGREMADKLFAARRDIFRDHTVVVIAAPGTSVPVAATMLAKHMLNRLNELCADVGYAPTEGTHIHRDMTYNNNYAHLPKEERVKLLAADSLYLNQAFTEGKFLLFVDDVRITGTHEEKLRSFLLDIKATNPFLFATYAAYLGEDASIEMRLNHIAIKSANDLVKLSKERGHRITTRAIRLLLEAPKAKFPALLRDATPGFVEEAYHAAMLKNYHNHGPYAANFRTLRAHYHGTVVPLRDAHHDKDRRRFRA